MYYVILASTYKDCGHTTSILGITTEEDKISEIIEEAENSDVFDIIANPYVIEVENINCFCPSFNKEEWDYSDE